jgi:hypothetical protein
VYVKVLPDLDFAACCHDHHDHHIVIIMIMMMHDHDHDDHASMMADSGAVAPAAIALFKKKDLRASPPNLGRAVGLAYSVLRWAAGLRDD